MVTDADCDSAGELLSLTVIVKLDDPLLVGVPEMVPVADENDRPAGNSPEVIAQLYGEVPPVACKVCT